MDLVIGQRINLKITDIAFGGEGVGRSGEFVVFVSFVLVGEEVEVEITEVKKRFARGRLVRVVIASPDRVAPPCRYFGDCGGCQYQHMAYSRQLEIKHKQVLDLFQRIGGLSGAHIDSVVPCPQPYGYRNRVMIRSQWDKFRQGLNIGYIRYDNRLVVDVESCVIAEPAINEQLTHVRAHPPPKGGIKVVLRRMPPGWDVHPDSFFQNNLFLLPALVERLRDAVRASGVRHVADIYCGVGFFGIELADLVESFVGIELDQRAIRSARTNAQARRVQNGEFLSGRAEDLLPEVLNRTRPGSTAVILDPPRTGCPSESLNLLRGLRVAQILYVSCHPATLARDIQMLTEARAYRLERVTPFDMFPQTQHVECIADLRWAGDEATSQYLTAG